MEFINKSQFNSHRVNYFIDYFGKCAREIRTGSETALKSMVIEQFKYIVNSKWVLNIAVEDHSSERGIKLKLTCNDMEFFAYMVKKEKMYYDSFETRSDCTSVINAFVFYHENRLITDNELKELFNDKPITGSAIDMTSLPSGFNPNLYTPEQLDDMSKSDDFRVWNSAREFAEKLNRIETLKIK